MLLRAMKRARHAGLVLAGAALLSAAAAPPANAQKPDTLWTKAPSLWKRSFNPQNVVFSPDGKVYAFSTPSLTEVYRTHDRKLLFTLPVYDSRFNPLRLSFLGNETIVTEETRGQTSTYKFWRVRDGDLLRTVERRFPGTPSPDFEHAVRAASDPATSLWTLYVHGFEDDARLYSTGGVRRWAFRPTESQLVVIRDDGSLQILRLSNGAVLREIPAATFGPNGLRDAWDLTFSPDGSDFAVWKSDGVELRSLIDGRLLETLPKAFNLAFESGGKFLTVWYAPEPGITRKLFLKKADGRWTRILPQLGAGYGPVFFSPDGRYLLTYAGDHEFMKLRRSDTGEVVREFPTGVPLGFSPDGEYVVIGLRMPTDPVHSGRGVYDYVTSFWRVSDGGRADAPGEDYLFITATAFSPDGQTLAAAAGDGTIRFFDARNGEMKGGLTGAPADTRELRYSNMNGPVTLTAIGDSGVRRWRVSDHQLLLDAVVEGTKVVVSGDEQRMAVLPPDGKSVEIRRVSDRALLHTLSVEGRKLVSAAFRGENGKGLVTFSTPTDPMASPAGRFERWLVDYERIHSILATTEDPHPFHTSDENFLAIIERVTETVPGSNARDYLRLSIVRIGNGQILRSETFASGVGGFPRYPFNVDLKTRTFMVADRVASTLELRNLFSGELLQSVPLEDTGNAWRTPDRSMLVTAGPNRVSFWGREDGKLLARYDREVSAFYHLSFSPDGRYMAYTQAGRVLSVARNPALPLPGDVDGSGRVEVTDAVLALRSITGSVKLSARERRVADLSADGEVTVQDVILILKAALGIGV
jgi:WD40 repeat protein